MKTNSIFALLFVVLTCGELAGQQVLVQLIRGTPVVVEDGGTIRHLEDEEFALDHELVLVDLDKRRVLARHVIGADSPIVSYGPEDNSAWVAQRLTKPPKIATRIRKFRLPDLQSLSEYDHNYPFGITGVMWGFNKEYTLVSHSLLPLNQTDSMVKAFVMESESPDTTKYSVAAIEGKTGKASELYPLGRSEQRGWNLFAVDKQTVVAIRSGQIVVLRDAENQADESLPQPRMLGSGLLIKRTGHGWDVEEYEGLRALKWTRRFNYYYALTVTSGNKMLFGLLGHALVTCSVPGEPRFRVVEFNPRLPRDRGVFEPAPGLRELSVDPFGRTACILYESLRVGQISPAVLVWVDLRREKVLGSVEAVLVGATCQVNETLTVVAQGPKLRRYRNGQAVDEEPFHLGGRRVVRIWPVSAPPP